jgi:hypothetical protein
VPTRLRLFVVLLGLAVLTGCQMHVAVDVRVEEDGSGAVTVGVGLDDAALRRAGNLDEQLRVDDLRAAGWYVAPPTREGEVTWVRATKQFATPEQAAAIFAEISGPQGAFRDFEVTREESTFGTTYSVDGVVDLTAGPAAFSDPELTAALEGDPFGGTLQAIEAEEGRPIAHMVDFRVSTALPGEEIPEVFEASFVDTEPTVVDASSTQSSTIASVWIWVIAIALGIIVLVVLRQGFRRVRA